MRRIALAFLALSFLAAVPSASAVDVWVYYTQDGSCVVGFSLSDGACTLGEGGGSGDSGVTAGVDLGVFAVCVNDNEPGVAGQCSHELISILKLASDAGALHLSGTGALPLA